VEVVDGVYTEVAAPTSLPSSDFRVAGLIKPARGADATRARARDVSFGVVSG